MNDRHEPIVRKSTGWAETEDGVRAVVVIGSQAREEGVRGRLAGLRRSCCLRMIPGVTFSTRNWIKLAGVPLICVAARVSLDGSSEMRVLYENAFDVDFAFSRVNDLDDPRSTDFHGLPLGKGQPVRGPTPGGETRGRRHRFRQRGQRYPGVFLPTV